MVVGFSVRQRASYPRYFLFDCLLVILNFLTKNSHITARYQIKVILTRSSTSVTDISLLNENVPD